MSDRYRGGYAGKARDNPRRNERYENDRPYDNYGYPPTDRQPSYHDHRSPRRREYENQDREYDRYRNERPDPREIRQDRYQHDRYPKYEQEPQPTKPYPKDIIKESIFLSNLPRDISVNELANLFGSIGVIQTDKRSGLLKIKLFYNTDGTSKGEASIYYEDPMAAEAAIKWFNHTEIRGQKIGVETAVRSFSNKFIEAERNEAKRRETEFVPREPERDRYEGGFRGRGDRGRGDRGRGGRGRGGFQGDRFDSRNERDSRFRNERSEREGRDSRREPDGKKSFVQPGDWTCLTCKNNNFAWRDSCNRCQAPKGGDLDRGNSGGYGSRRRTPPHDAYSEFQRNYPYNA